MGTPSQSYGTSLAIWDHTVLPATRHKWTRPAYNPSHTGWYSIYRPRRDRRLSWPRWFDSAPAGDRTSNLSITSPTPHCCTTNWQPVHSSMRMIRAITKVRLNLSKLCLEYCGLFFPDTVYTIRRKLTMHDVKTNTQISSVVSSLLQSVGVWPASQQQL